MIRQSQGFTLIEIMVAMAIFGMLSLGAYTVLDAGVRSQQQTELRLDQISRLQAAVRAIEKDLQMLSLRSVRNDLGDKIPLLRGEGDAIGQVSFIEFTRSNWRNPANLPRSNLQHLIYNFSEGELTREHSIFLDQAPNSPKITRRLLQNVDSLSFSFLDKDNQWQTSWAMFGTQASTVSLPRAIKLSMQLDRFGLIERIIPVDLVAND